MKEAFWQSIMEQPSDDATRLIYADWLEQNNEEELAEFIRIQIELANQKQWVHQRTAYLKKREKEILDKNKAKWSKDFPKKDFRFHKGFIGYAITWANSNVSFLDLSPIVGLTVCWWNVDDVELIKKYIQHSRWKFIKEIEFSGVCRNLVWLHPLCAGKEAILLPSKSVNERDTPYDEFEYSEHHNWSPRQIETFIKKTNVKALGVKHTNDEISDLIKSKGLELLTYDWSPLSWR